MRRDCWRASNTKDLVDLLAYNRCYNYSKNDPSCNADDAFEKTVGQIAQLLIDNAAF